MQQSTAPWYLFNYFIRKAGYINITLGHLLLEATSKGFNVKEALLNC